MGVKLAELQDLTILTEMNIQLREDEQIDNKMTDSEVQNRMADFLHR